MRLFLDSADAAAWERLLPMDIFYGVTTNPLLAQRAGLAYAAIDWTDLAGKAADLGAKELQVQVSGDPEGYDEWAEEMYEIGEDAGLEIVIKIPLVEEAIARFGLIKALDGKITLTACHDAKQVLVARALGADYIAPYAGRMEEMGRDLDQQVADMTAAARGGDCRILAASIRSPDMMVRLARHGVDAFAISPEVAHALFDDAATSAAYAQFEAAASG